jgi:hypothetical protein
MMIFSLSRVDDCELSFYGSDINAYLISCKSLKRSLMKWSKGYRSDCASLLGYTSSSLRIADDI